jgi:endonuclease/exonuclease/phosphatase family metal-dependent hydrolase
MTAALLKMKGNTSPFWFINTHLDHLGEGARLLGSLQIMRFIQEKKQPVILTGDFNAEPNSIEIKTITENELCSLRDCTSGLGETFHNYSNTPFWKIDYIFTSFNFDISKSIVYPDDPIDGVYLSDHRPVGAVIEVE